MRPAMTLTLMTGDDDARRAARATQSSHTLQKDGTQPEDLTIGGCAGVDTGRNCPSLTRGRGGDFTAVPVSLSLFFLFFSRLLGFDAGPAAAAADRALLPLGRPTGTDRPRRFAGRGWDTC